MVSQQQHLARGIKSAYRDSREYYLIGFAPAGASKGRGAFRRIKLKVRRAGVRLRYREGYWLESEAAREASLVSSALGNPSLYFDFPLAAEVLPQETQWRVTLFLPVRALDFRREDSTYACPIEVHAQVVDSRHHWRYEVPYSRGYRLQMRAEQWEALLKKDNVAAQFTLPRSSSDRELIVVVRQGARQQMASIVRPLDPPESASEKKSLAGAPATRSG